MNEKIRQHRWQENLLKRGDCTLEPGLDSLSNREPITTNQRTVQCERKRDVNNSPIQHVVNTEDFLRYDHVSFTENAIIADIVNEGVIVSFNATEFRTTGVGESSPSTNQASITGSWLAAEPTVFNWSNLDHNTGALQEQGFQISSQSSSCCIGLQNGLSKFSMSLYPSVGSYAEVNDNLDTINSQTVEQHDVVSTVKLNEQKRQCANLVGVGSNKIKKCKRSRIVAANANSNDSLRCGSDRNESGSTITWNEVGAATKWTHQAKSIGKKMQFQIDRTEGNSVTITTSRDERRRTLKKRFVKMGSSESKNLKNEASLQTAASINSRDFTFELAEMACLFIRTSSSLDERDRRIVILDSLRVNAREVWNHLTDKEKGEKSYVIAALHSTELPRSITNSYDWIKSASLRNDRDVVLAILKCDLAFTTIDGRFSIPLSLRNDKEVMMEYISNRNGRLTLVHESLLADKDVVMAAVAQNGQDLQFASDALRMNSQVVKTACHVYGDNFRFSLGEARRQLGSDPVFMTNVFESFKGGAMLEFASDDIQRDPFFVSKALVNDFEFARLPEFQRTDQAFLLKLIEHDFSVYTKFPIRLKRNRNFATLAIFQCKDTFGSAETYKQKAVIADVCEYANFLFREDSSHRLLTGTPVTVAQEILRKGSGFIDKNLVLIGVRHNPFLYGEHLQEPFRSDLDVIRTAITRESAGHILRYVPRWTLLNNPKLMVLAIQACCASNVASNRDSLSAAGLVPWEIFRHRAVAVEWAGAGLPLTPSFPTDFANDEDICLLFLSNLQNTWRHRLRKWISVDLKGKKSFMIKACAFDASFFSEGTNGLSHDYNVLLVAASVDFDQVVRTITEQSEYAALRHFCEQAENRLRACECFNIVASGVNCESNVSSILPLLDQGKETREALLQLIACHLDLPASDEMQCLEAIRFTVRQLLRTLPKK
jgi:hypothetical protein